MARYTRVKCRLWHDEKVRALTEDGRMCFFYVLTSPHSNMLGMYVLAPGYAAEDLQWPVERFRKAFAELLDKQLVKHDAKTNLVLIRNYLEHNPLENGKQVIAALKVLEELPTSPLFVLLNEALERLGKPYAEPLREQLSKRCGKPVSVSVTVYRNSKDNELAPQALAPYPPDFEAFWQAYPRKREKKDAYVKWRTCLNKGFKPDDIIAAARHYADECLRKGTPPGYIKHAARFLGPSEVFTDYIAGIPESGGIPRGRATGRGAGQVTPEQQQLIDKYANLGKPEPALPPGAV